MIVSLLDAAGKAVCICPSISVLSNATTLPETTLAESLHSSFNFGFEISTV